MFGSATIKSSAISVPCPSILVAKVAWAPAGAPIVFTLSLVVHSFAYRQSDTCDEVFEARIGSQSIEGRAHIEVNEPPLSVAIRSFEPVDGLVVLPQARERCGERECRGLSVVPFLQFLIAQRGPIAARSCRGKSSPQCGKQLRGLRQLSACIDGRAEPLGGLICRNAINKCVG